MNRGLQSGRTFSCNVAAAVLCAIFVARGAAWADEIHTAIFVMKIDGTEVRKVADVEGFREHGSPRWSHDGRRLAFDAYNSPSGARKFFVIDLDGSGLKDMGENAMPDWSPDDKQLAFHAYGDGTLKAGVWVEDLSGQGRVWLATGGSPRWSPDGGRLAYTNWRSLVVLDLVEQNELDLLPEPFQQISIGFAWSPDGKRLAFSGQRANQRELCIVSVDDVSQGVRVRLQANVGNHTTWSPDGKQLAFSLDDRIQLIEVDGDAAPRPVPGQQDRNTSPAWSPDGKWLAYSSDRKSETSAPQTVRNRDFKLREAMRHPKGTIVYGAAFTPDGQRLVMGGDPVHKGVQVWEPATGATKELGGEGILIAMFPDGKHFAASWLSPTVQIVDLDSGDVTRELQHGPTITAIAVSKDGSRLVTAALDKVLNVWDVATGDKVCTFDGHGEWITRAIFSADGKFVISAGHDKKVRLWDARTGKQHSEIEHPEVVWALAVSPDGSQILTGTGGALLNNPLNLVIAQGDDNVLRLWNAETGKLIREMKGHANTVFAADISPDGRLAISGGWDGSVRLWDLATGRESSRIEGWQGGIMKVLFAPDGKQAIVGGGVGRLNVRQLIEYPDERLRVYQVVEDEDKPRKP